MSQDCPICLRPISSPWVVCSPCGHPLHDECKRELINNGRGRQCPICNTHVRRFVKVYMDVSDPDPERIQQLEATAIECKEMSDHYMAEMIAREEDVCNLKNELEKKDDLLSAKSERIRLLTKELNDKAVEIVTAVSNAQHFIRKLSARDIEIRELNAKLDETETVIEDIRSDLQYSIDEVSSHKDAIFRLERQLQDKDVEIEKTCSSAARAIRQMNARDKTIRQLQAKLKQQDDVWKMENELLHCVILALRFLFSLLEVLLLFLWILDYGSEEQARLFLFSKFWYYFSGYLTMDVKNKRGALS